MINELVPKIYYTGWPAEGYRFYHDSSLAFSPAFTFVMVNWTRLLVQGQVYPKLEFGNQSGVMYAVSPQGHCVGAIVFYMLDDGQGHTAHTSIDPGHRGLMLHEALYSLVRDNLKQRGAKSISTGCWSTNEGMKQALERSGRQLCVVRGTENFVSQLDFNPQLLDTES